MNAFDHRTTLRAAGLLLGLAVYYAFDWEVLQHLWRFAFSAGLATIGHHVQLIGIEEMQGFAVDGLTYSLSRNCTYMDLVLLLAPLIWRPGRTAAFNFRQIGFLIAGLVAFNFLRVTFAIHMNVSEGIDWEIVHFWPDLVFHFTIIVGMAFRAMWVDWSEVGPETAAPATLLQQA